MTHPATLLSFHTVFHNDTGPPAYPPRFASQPPPPSDNLGTLFRRLCVTTLYILSILDGSFLRAQRGTANRMLALRSVSQQGSCLLGWVSFFFSISFVLTVAGCTSFFAHYTHYCTLLAFFLSFLYTRYPFLSHAKHTHTYIWKHHLILAERQIIIRLASVPCSVFAITFLESLDLPSGKLWVQTAGWYIDGYWKRIHNRTWLDI